MTGAIALFGAWFPAAACGYSLLPLAAEQVETLPHGVAEAVLGVDYFRNLRFPPFTPPGALQHQDLVGIPQFGFHIGAGGWAEIQASYETLYLNEEAANGKKNWQFGSGDLRMFTKVRLTHEGETLPAFGIRFGAKLPDANRKDRLGTDDTDFGADVLVSKNLGPVTAHVNLGILLLGNSGPTIATSNGFKAGGQDDTFHYDVAVVSPPLGLVEPGSVTVRLVGELAGLSFTHYDNAQEALRAGLQAQRGPGTFYLGASVGLIAGSEDFGASAGFIYTFEPGKLFDRE
ncbi:MAG: hypothetical protein ACHQ9S_12550 [Candidatus Binatia bacterium]